MQLSAKQLKELVRLMEMEIYIEKKKLENPSNWDIYKSQNFITKTNHKIETFQAFIDEAKQETEMINVKIIR